MKSPSLLSLLTGLALASPLVAGSPQATPQLDTSTGLNAWLDGKYATGTWGGLRDTLEEHGVEFFGYYTADIAGNPVGGRKEGGFTYVDDFYFGFNFDLEKLLGWPGGHFTISGVNRDGRSLTEEYVGSQYNSQQVYGGQNVFLYQVYLDQHFFDDKVSLKLGRFGASDDFNASPIYGLYMNNGINGDIRNILFNTQFSAYPFSTWAARVRIDPTPEINAQVGVFQTWRDVFDNTHNGLNWGIRSEDGVFLVAQFGWTPELFKREVPGSADGKSGPQLKGLPGHYWVGAYYSPWDYPQFGRVEAADKSYGFYVHGDQMVYRESWNSDQGLTVWAASGISPQESVAIMPFQVNAGLVYKGLFEGRDEDRTTLGLIYGRFSRDYAGTVKTQGQGDPRYELVLEAGHRFQIAKWAYIQPDVQYIIRPGGTGGIGDALVVGAQIGVTF